MALQVITLEQIKARSGLAEIQVLDVDGLEVLEADALDLLEAELGRRLTMDATDVTITIPGSGLTILPLPERLSAKTSVVSECLGDITECVQTIVGGWMLEGIYPRRYHFFSPVTVTGRWGLACPARAQRVLMDVIEALAVRRADPVSHRDELSPWGSVADGGLRADRDSAHRKETLENLLTYDLRKRLSGLYRPDMVAVV
ncbi:MAG: hypothetical protein JXA87_07880 [Thermoleophilia bacterium]|nr:hypothetical protein [Thermoleophilia bacterium]